MKGLLVALVLVVVISISGSQPIPKTAWTVINENAAVDSSSYPRIATFSNGDYIIVYGISQDIVNNRIAFKIFSSAGLVKVPESVVSGSVGNYYAPNVLVVGDVAVIVWRDVFGNTAYQSQVTNDGVKIIGSSLQLPSSSFNKEDAFGLFMVNNVTFGMTLSPSNESAPTIVYYRIGSTAPFFQVGDTSALEIPSAIYDPRINTTLTFVQRYNNYYAVSYYEGEWGGLGLSTSLTVNQFKYTVPFLTDDPLALGFITSAAQPSAIRLGILDTLHGQLSVAYGLMFDPITTQNMRPDAIHLGSNYALIAHSTRNFSLAYRYVRINEDSYDLIGPVMNEEPMSSNGVSMAKVGNNIVVTAFDAKPSCVMTRVLTFCGNGVVDSNFNEQCDSSSGCSTDCTCVKGTLAKSGLCLDVCGNGIVTGNEDCDGTLGCDPVTCKCQAGYQPYIIQQRCRPIPASFVPKVGPSLDCLTITNNSLNLFFSFVSSDSFDQTIEYGAMNDFTPNNLATDRPTFFKSGTSLTYPVSPYNLTVSSTLSLFTWLLGSYNLTVDLSGDKASALQCPKNAGFVMTVATFDTLNDSDVQQLVLNIAHKYNISTDRLDATYRLSTVGSVSQPNIYSISITILASTNLSDPSAQDILKELYSDLKDSKDQLSSELTQGLSEKNPQIKDVTPNPTGVEVRSQQRDVAPTAVNVGPMTTSGALPSMDQVFWCIVMAFLALW